MKIQYYRTYICSTRSGGATSSSSKEPTRYSSKYRVIRIPSAMLECIDAISDAMKQVTTIKRRAAPEDTAAPCHCKYTNPRIREIDMIIELMVSWYTWIDENIPCSESHHQYKTGCGSKEAQSICLRCRMGCSIDGSGPGTNSSISWRNSERSIGTCIVF